MTQQEFGELIGVDRRTVMNYEKGKKIPDSKVKILELLDTSGALPKKASSKETSSAESEDLRREISDLKDHIKTLKQLIEEKDKLAEMYKKENEILKGDLDDLKKG